jgi:hypothetical protein
MAGRQNEQPNQQKQNALEKWKEEADHAQHDEAPSPK